MEALVLLVLGVLGGALVAGLRSGEEVDPSQQLQAHFREIGADTRQQVDILSEQYVDDVVESLWRRE